jgi:hypothetical protein
MLAGFLWGTKLNPIFTDFQVYCRGGHQPMEFENQRIKEEILMSLSEDSKQRIKPYILERTLSHRLGVSTHTIHQGVKDLLEEGKLVYTYRDPDSYIEVAEEFRSIV